MEEISKVALNISKKIALESKDTDSKSCDIFFQKLFSTIKLEDLQEFQNEYTYIMCHKLWNLVNNKKNNDNKLEISEIKHQDICQTLIILSKPDSPFIINSILMLLNKHGVSINLLLHAENLYLERKNKKIKNIKFTGNLEMKEGALLINISKISCDALDAIKYELNQIIVNEQKVTACWQYCIDEVREIINEINKIKICDNLKTQTTTFLEWILSNNFTFFGFENINVENMNDMGYVIDKQIGFLPAKEVEKNFEYLKNTIKYNKINENDQIVCFYKSPINSNIHRSSYIDNILIIFKDKENIIYNVKKISGLMGSNVYNSSPTDIPIIKQKVSNIINQIVPNRDSYKYRKIKNILSTLPRDELFQASTEELIHICQQITHIQDRPQVKLILRKKFISKMMSCLVYIPRDKFNTILREKITKLLTKKFDAHNIHFSVYFQQYSLARIYFYFNSNIHSISAENIIDIEKSIKDMCVSWVDKLCSLLMNSNKGSNDSCSIYAPFFPESYKEFFSPKHAIEDIKYIEKLTSTNNIEFNVYEVTNNDVTKIKFKIYQYDQAISLSEIVPIIENMGLTVISQRPYCIKKDNNTELSLIDFTLHHYSNNPFKIDRDKHLFQESFNMIWRKKISNDCFNKLVLSSQLNYRDVLLIRTITKYLNQINFTITEAYIINTLYKHPEISSKLVKMFVYKFHPRLKSKTKLSSIEKNINEYINKVRLLDEDRVIRAYYNIISSTVRTNFYQDDKDFISLKIQSNKINNIPNPKPEYEIFIYSIDFEGIHLRSSKISRGGIRWSDRKSDYRTEVLGLMKAQVVKNSVIVPSGAKGGFIINSDATDPDSLKCDAKKFYKKFITGLLDITDNVINGDIIKPTNVICHDDDDTYLVVAADKGTATFSDTANKIAEQHNFWLKDAFASGGKTGYDHKKMAITAKGAWESAKIQFKRIGKDIINDTFTVTGIGDMAGDVFGNGMILSKNLKLIAAFNHTHIFIDPKPEPIASFNERKRLFLMNNSTWEDYNKSIISAGGGIYKLDEKNIILSNEAKKVLKTKSSKFSPNELIKVILEAPVDMLWNGGIGTYVKSVKETNSDINDKDNDNKRINSNSLRCKIIVEGGNLGISPLARMDFSLRGGLIFGDFIDNSAGVDCSDHEVNLKILLNNIVSNNKMSLDERNVLLKSLSDEISTLVLRNNFNQAQAISMLSKDKGKNNILHSRFMKHLGKECKKHKKLESYIDDKYLIENNTSSNFLTEPSIAIIISYSKQLLTEELLRTDIFNDPYFNKYLEEYFPKIIYDYYQDEVFNHSLKKEIISTKISNEIIERMGVAFIFRMQEETSATISDIVKAYVAVNNILDIDCFYKEILESHSALDTEIYFDAICIFAKLIRRICHNVLKQYKNVNIGNLVKIFKPCATNLVQYSNSVLKGDNAKYYKSLHDKFSKHAFSLKVINFISLSRILNNIIDISNLSVEFDNINFMEIAKLYYKISDTLKTGWLKDMIINHNISDHWDALTREQLRDNLDDTKKSIMREVLTVNEKDIMNKLEIWQKLKNHDIKRWDTIISNIKKTKNLTIPMSLVAISELKYLISNN